jgi:hypothetical protein
VLRGLWRRSPIIERLLHQTMISDAKVTYGLCTKISAILLRMKRLKPRLISFCLMLIVGVGTELYFLDAKDKTGMHCYGCTSWQCHVVNAGHHPISYVRYYIRPHRQN